MCDTHVMCDVCEVASAAVNMWLSQAPVPHTHTHTHKTHPSPAHTAHTAATTHLVVPRQQRHQQQTPQLCWLPQHAALVTERHDSVQLGDGVRGAAVAAAAGAAADAAPCACCILAFDLCGVLVGRGGDRS
jgi:hypothetical protein